jgi:hypothetical protein
MIEKETLTVEWLPAYNKYRVWNTWTECWYKTKEELLNALSQVFVLYDFVTYGTPELVKDFENIGLELTFHE